METKICSKCCTNKVDIHKYIKIIAYIMFIISVIVCSYDIYDQYKNTNQYKEKGK